MSSEALDVPLLGLRRSCRNAVMHAGCLPILATRDAAFNTCMFERGFSALILQVRSLFLGGSPHSLPSHLVILIACSPHLLFSLTLICLPSYMSVYGFSLHANVGVNPSRGRTSASHLSPPSWGQRTSVYPHPTSSLQHPESHSRGSRYCIMMTSLGLGLREVNLGSGAP